MSAPRPGPISSTVAGRRRRGQVDDPATRGSTRKCWPKRLRGAEPCRGERLAGVPPRAHATARAPRRRRVRAGARERHAERQPRRVEAEPVALAAARRRHPAERDHRGVVGAERGGGTYTLEAVARRQRCHARARRPRFAATPPEITTARSISRAARATRTCRRAMSTTPPERWRAGRRACARPAARRCARTCCATAVLSPLKLKSKRCRLRRSGARQADRAAGRRRARADRSRGPPG